MTKLRVRENDDLDRILQPAADVLERGGVIAYPTETVYGLGADIYNKAAVERIYQIKERSSGKPLSVLLSSQEDVYSICSDIPDFARWLMQRYWPGPLTLVFKASTGLPEHMAGPGGTIGVRVTSHPIIEALMKLYRKPITTTSANFSGQPPAVRGRDVERMLGKHIDLLIDAGICPGRVPSTVLDATGSEPVVLRQGDITIEQITNCLQGNDG